MYDIIGDIHGHSEELKYLLKDMAYEKRNGCYSHPERTAVFVGDFIDRGPGIRETLRIARNMVESGKALATMGNHEYNALCFHTKNENGEWMKKHSENNVNQHKATLEQFEMHGEELKSHLNWFYTLPLYLDLGEIRIVHACWDYKNMNVLNGTDKISEKLLAELNSPQHYKKSDLFKAIDECIKGREEIIPDGYTFNDKYGKERKEMRIRWYLSPKKCCYKDYYMEEIKELNGKKVDTANLMTTDFYNENDKPVFCGHYWFTGTPKRETKNVACVDYSIGKGEKLAAYRWSGEKELDDRNFIWVESKRV